MQELKPNWKIAAQISWLHTAWSNQITGTLVLIFLIITSIYLILTGHHLTLTVLVDFLLKYKFTIILTILVIHFIPVNLYVLTKVLQHHFPSFRIMLVKEAEKSEKKQ